MTTHSAFDARFWNLAQSAAWIVHRDRKVIEELANCDKSGYGAFVLWGRPEHTEEGASLAELQAALEDGRLVAQGYRDGGDGRIEEVPLAEWADLLISPPCVHRRGWTSNYQPWTDVIVECSKVRKLWRSISETSGRSKFDWGEIKKIHDERKSVNPTFSQNALIDEIQAAHQERFPRKSVPARSTIQAKMRLWR